MILLEHGPGGPALFDCAEGLVQAHDLSEVVPALTRLDAALFFGGAVLVSALTTIAGFGSLVVADHRGIRSLGSIMAAGTAACMVAGLTSLPALLTLQERRKRAKKPAL